MIARSLRLVVCSASLVLLGACASTGATPASGGPDVDADPVEVINRPVFAVNDGLDIVVLEPLGTGWSWITFEQMRLGIDRFMHNLRFPVRFVGTLLQGELAWTSEETARFAVNTTAGIAGFFDPARRYLDLEPHDEDFGQALGRWGVPPGAYLMLPFFGPSNPRDVVGLVVDSALGSGPSLINPWFGAGVGAVNLLNSRALLLEPVRDAKAASLDYYVFVRNGYVQRRARAVSNTEEPGSEIDEELYEIDSDE